MCSDNTATETTAEDDATLQAAIDRIMGTSVQREQLEAAAATAAAEAAAVNDPLVVAEEAATFDACRQAIVDVRIINRSEVAMPASFARGAPRFFVAKSSIVLLAHPNGTYGASPKWGWWGGMRRNQFVSFGRDVDHRFAAHGYRCSLPGDKKLWRSNAYVRVRQERRC